MDTETFVGDLSPEYTLFEREARRKRQKTQPTQTDRASVHIGPFYFLLNKLDYFTVDWANRKKRHDQTFKGSDYTGRKSTGQDFEIKLIIFLE
jgi:hypothetical protein